MDTCVSEHQFPATGPRGGIPCSGKVLKHLVNLILDVLDRFGEVLSVRVVGLFFGDDWDIIDQIVDMSNVYAETSVYSRTLRIEKVLEKGYELMMFGSDAPFDDQEVALLKIMKSRMDDERREMILSGNAIRLLGEES